MKAILFIVIIGFLFSCNSTDKTNESPEPILDSVKPLDAEISISGSWVNENYFNKIIKTQSPLKSQDSALFIIIPDKLIRKTSMIYNFHEGSSPLEIVKSNNQYEIWELYNDSLKRRIYDVKIISESKISLSNKVFVKVSTSTNSENLKVLQEILFKGIYTDLNNKRIEFKPNGQITGLDAFNFYEPVVDYYDEGMQVDQIRLGKTKTDLENFGFIFRADTLELYKLHCVDFVGTSDICARVEYGQLIYRVWRRK